jgi:hypothetical protein
MSRPSDLTEELTLKIRALVLEGLQYNNIQQTLGISDNTWDTWVHKDYKDFRKNLISWKKERLVKLSEKVSNDILQMPAIDDKGNVATDVLRIKQKESEFIRETLGKDDYSKRNEVTGKDGKDLINTVLVEFLDKQNEPTNNDIDSNRV